jgi:voltage-gated potassium channel
MDMKKLTQDSIHRTRSPIRHRAYEIIENIRENDIVGTVVNRIIIVLICLNIVSIIAESFEHLNVFVLAILRIFEYLSVAVFTLEYLTRLWTAVERFSESKHPFLKYIISPMAVLDLLAIAPFYLPMFFHFDLRFLRVLRLFRLLRVFKLNRYSDSLNLIGTVIRKEKSKLLMTGFVIIVMIILASSVMYYFENAVQPEKFPNIIATLWWAISTLTTVGYGDVYPITYIGKFLSSIFAILGVGLVALPSGIICTGMINEINEDEHRRQERREEKVIICPCCGQLVRLRDNIAILRTVEHSVERLPPRDLNRIGIDPGAEKG